MRLLALLAAWVVGVLLVAFAIHVVSPFAPWTVSAGGAGLIGLAVVIAGRLTRDRKAFDATTVFDIRAAIGNLAIVIGGAAVAGFLLWDHWHEDVFVHDGLPVDVRISVDGHLLGNVPSGGDAKFEDLPTNAERIVAADGASGKPLDTADLDSAAGDGRGRFVFDVGGETCWQITEIRYASTHSSLGGLGGDTEPHEKLSLGKAHLFRAKSDFVGDAPTSVSSSSSSETRTLLERADCAGGR